MTIGAAFALLLAAPAAAELPPPVCEDSGLFCNQAVASRVVKRFGLPSAEDLAKQGYTGIRIFTEDGHGGLLPVVSVLREGANGPTIEAHDPGKPPRVAPANDATWRAALNLSAVLKAGPASYVLTDPEAICLHPWTFAIEVIEPAGVTVRARDTCALEQTGLDAQALSNAAVDAIPGCERLNRSSYQGIPAYRLRACFTLDPRRRGVAADAVNAWEASPMAVGGHEGPRPEDWLTPGVSLDWPDRGPMHGRDALAKFWLIVTDEDSEKKPSDLGLSATTARYKAARAMSDRRVRITGELWQNDDPDRGSADFSQEWILGDDGRWRLARWIVGDFAAKGR